MRHLWVALRRIRSRFAGIGRKGRIAAAAMAGCVLLGGVWMLWGAGESESQAALPLELTGADLQAAKSALREAGIPSRVETGRVVVPATSLSRAKEVLTRSGPVANDAAAAFRELAAESDIWSTQAQSRKRWRAQQMSTLATLIERFPAVRSATVLLEAEPRGPLGRWSRKPSAAATVELEDEEVMSPTLVTAIADLVSGSIAGLEAQDVRVVDCRGRSYRAGRVSAEIAARIEQAWYAESSARERILAALGHIPGVSVCVRVSYGPDGAENRTASVSVPRSYLLAIGCQGRTPADEGSLAKLAAPHLEKVHQAAALALGPPESSAVTVDWHYDVPAKTDASAAPTAAGAPASGSPIYAAAWIGALAMLGFAASAAGLVCYRRARRRRHKPPAEGEAGILALDGPNPFEFLHNVHDEDLLACLARERPDTIAIVLAHLSAERAAKVLGQMPPRGQVEVARRIAGQDAEQLTPEAVLEIDRALSEQFDPDGRLKQRGPGGAAALASILEHAGYATEQSVLAGLSNDTPLLADSVRQRMFAFEDIVLMPPERLGGVLETIDVGELAVALRTVGDDARAKVLESLSSHAASRLRKEMERIGPVRLSDVETAQLHVAETVARMNWGRYVAAETDKPSGIVA